MRARIKSISWQFMKFAAIGAVGTTAHYLLLIALVEAFSARPAIASTAGFTIGAAVNYCLNYRFTFHSSSPHAMAIPRFLLIAGIGALINVTLMWLLAESAGVYYLAAQLVATAVVLAWNFAGSRHWAFKHRRECPAQDEEEIS